MKITKKYLQKVINEEIHAVLNENKVDLTTKILAAFEGSPCRRLKGVVRKYGLDVNDLLVGTKTGFGIIVHKTYKKSIDNELPAATACKK